jgi:hypothetical protein
MFQTVSLSIMRSLALYTQQQVYVYVVAGIDQPLKCRGSFLNGVGGYEGSLPPLLLSSLVSHAQTLCLPYQ